MEDRQIIALYEARSENAIRETKKKYGRYILTIARRILTRCEAAEEIENDTYLSAWESIPPARPDPLSAFLGMLARRRALDRLRQESAARRGYGEVTLSLEELCDCLPAGGEIDERLSATELARCISDFLRTLPRAECDLFLRRYWYFDPIKQIALRRGCGQSRIKMQLSRTRAHLAAYLQEKGYSI